MTVEQRRYTSNALNAPSAFDLIIPRSSDFATAPIQEASCWNEYAAAVPDLTHGYLVVFRSRLRVNADRARIQLLEEEEEAMPQKGFKGYFKGPLHEETRRNLSCCLWETKENAIDAA